MLPLNEPEVIPVTLSQALQSETPGGASESTRTARNGVRFHNTVDTGCLRRITLSERLSEDAVSVGRDEVRRPDSRSVQEVDRKFPTSP